jgi:hypothetical protein
MYTLLRRWYLNVTLAVCISAIGCGGEGPVKIKAKVTLDGKPLQGATILLQRSDGHRKRGAVGESDADGMVRFTTFQRGDGVLPGEYKVVVNKTDTSQAQSPDEFDGAALDDPQVQKRIRESGYGSPSYQRGSNILPRTYSNPTTTPLLCRVPPDDEPVIFALDSQIGQ